MTWWKKELSAKKENSFKKVPFFNKKYQGWKTNMLNNWSTCSVVCVYPFKLKQRFNEILRYVKNNWVQTKTQNIKPKLWLFICVFGFKITQVSNSFKSVYYKNNLTFDALLLLLFKFLLNSIINILPSLTKIYSCIHTESEN